LTRDIKYDVLIADKGYDTDAIIETALENCVEAVIPPKKNRKEQRYYDREIYEYRHLVENIFAVLKRWRGIATRYAKHTKSYLAAVQIACAVGWWKSIVDRP